MAAKYLAIYNGMPLPFDDFKVFAVKILGYRIIKNCRGEWDIIINEKEVAHYTDAWTLDEVEKDFFSERFLSKFTFKNLHYYQLIGNK